MRVLASGASMCIEVDQAGDPLARRPSWAPTDRDRTATLDRIDDPT
jgi:hypothetical protein